MNETVKNILGRRSVRDYTPILPPLDEIESIIDCGRFAATANGRQPWFFSVVTDRALLDEISTECRRVMEEETGVKSDEHYDSFRTAPMAVVVSAEDAALYGEADAANAVENMAIAAWSYGIGSCYLASFRRAFKGDKNGYFREKLRVPEGFTPKFALSLGYAASPLPPRKDRAEKRVEYIE